MQPGVEEQDEAQLHDHRRSLTGTALRTAIKHDALPNADKHAAIVQRLREKSAEYYNLQLIVRILVLFREWRHEEEELIKLVFSSYSFKSWPLANKCQTPYRSI
jgi:nuclear pore complex protein Nup107